jgi:hypothetical protein
MLMLKFLDFINKRGCYIFQEQNHQQATMSEAELDSRAHAGETVVEGGTGGKSLDAQKRLAEGMYFRITLAEFCG